MAEWRGEETPEKSWRSSLSKLAAAETDAEESVVGCGDNTMVAAMMMVLVKCRHSTCRLNEVGSFFHVLD